MSTEQSNNVSLPKAKRHRRLVRNTLKGIKKNPIRRLALIGGVLRLSKDVYPQVRSILKESMTRVLSNACTRAEYARRKTITREDIIQALKDEKRPIYDIYR